jgi:exosortase A-associated hydrolase 1
MIFEDVPLQFSCDGAELIGVLSLPLKPDPRGVLFVVGGPQYRSGSHRQFTLLARQLAEQGVAVMRFDYRGMGDSEGEQRDFTSIDDDIRAAINCFLQHAPGVEEVVLWGLCDAASAALFYAHKDIRVTGLVLLNPWVRTEQGAAKALLKHYYVQRLLDIGFWKKIASGNFNPIQAARSLSQQFQQILLKRRNASVNHDTRINTSACENLPDKMAHCLRQFKGPALFILSSNDLTAQEFSDLVNASNEWKKLMSESRTTRRELAGANHTFSQRRWREQVGQWTIDWIRE